MQLFIIVFFVIIIIIFLLLHDAHRMNSATAGSSSLISTNTSDGDTGTASPRKKWWRIALKYSSSNPVPIYKQILQDESTQLIPNEESVSSNDIGSYMSAELLSNS